jgi:hypothetical protein
MQALRPCCWRSKGWQHEDSQLPLHSPTWLIRDSTALCTCVEALPMVSPRGPPVGNCNPLCRWRYPKERLASLPSPRADNGRAAPKSSISASANILSASLSRRHYGLPYLSHVDLSVAAAMSAGYSWNIKVEMVGSMKHCIDQAVGDRAAQPFSVWTMHRHQTKELLALHATAP